MGDPHPKELLRTVLAELAGEGSDLGTMEETLPRMTELLERYASPGFTCLMRGLPPTPPVTYEGVNGLAEAWADFGEAFESVRAVLEGVRESDNHVVVLVDQVATTRHGGVEMHQPSAMMFSFEGEHVTGVEFHLDRDEALRVAGIPD